MDVKRCAAVVAAAECGAMSSAAKLLGYTPSGIIRLVDSLEEELGFPILIRKTTGVELTPEGRSILPLLKEVTATDERVHQAASRLRGRAEGVVTVGVGHSIASYWFPSVVQAYKKRYPELNLRVVEASVPELQSLLDKKHIDCAVFFGKHERFDWIPLGKCELVAWIPKSSPLAQNSSLMLVELKGEPYVRLYPGEDIHAERLLRERGVEPDVKFQTSDALTAFSMVGAGLGVALCMGGVADSMKGDVKVVPLSPQRFLEYGIATPEGSVASPSLREFIDVAMESSSDWPALKE